jgi:hypothetical protein
MKQVFLQVILLLVCSCMTGQPPQRFDIIIHELLADPSPQVGLPNSEFVELRNISSGVINLRNWKLTDGSSTATINSNYLLAPDSCVVVCATSAQVLYAGLGSAVGIANFPSLNNDTDMLWLVAPDGRVIHAVAYEQSWYRNAVKSEGGWTLEMIDAGNPCGDGGNWMASKHPTGGTPGRRNSVEGNNPDEHPPSLLRTYLPDSITIAVLFDEPLDSANASLPINYRFDKGLVPARAVPVPPVYKQVNLTMAAPLPPGTVYTLTVSGITDCAGNSIGMLNTARAGQPSNAIAGGLVINEVLFNPPPGGADYIEFYNRSNMVLDASALHLGGRGNNGDIVVAGKLAATSYLLFPGDHIVVTENISQVTSRFVAKHPMNILRMDKLPSLPDDKGSIVLLNAQGSIIDELLYDEKWHFPLIANAEGVSLERIHPSQPTQNHNNWTSAASDAGYGTPTYRNSQHQTALSVQGAVTVRPAAFSPNNDGRDDACLIHYELGAPNNVASITVFDLNGNVVRNICNNATLSQQGFFRWDGLDNSGNRLPMGVYIVLTALFDLQGRRNNFKNTVTLAHGF